MCPACLTTAAFAIATTSSAGGLAAFIARLRRARMRTPISETRSARPADR